MTQPSRNLFGVIIGVDQYRDPNIPDLQFAVEDAHVFYDRLVQSFSKEEIAVELLLNSEANLRSVRKSIGEDLARQTKPDDLVVLFFAGHGSPETGSTIDESSRYLVLHDTEYDNIYATALDLEIDFVRLLERIRSRHIVVFIDACFSGRAGGRTFEGPRLQYLRKEFRGTPIELNKLELGEGRIVITACDDTEVAREQPQFRHGVFTHYLLEVLCGEASERDTISVATLYDEVADKVSRFTRGRQNPIFNGRGKSPRFPLLKCL